jgi:hypothetical protein
MAYINKTTAFCVLFLALYTVFLRVEAEDECNSHEDCPTSLYCCGRRYLESVCEYSCLWQSCNVDSDCASGEECCSSHLECFPSGRCDDSGQDGWIAAVIAISILVVLGIALGVFLFCCCCSALASRRRAHGGVIVTQPTTTTVFSNQGQPMDYQPNPAQPYPAQQPTPNDPLIATTTQAQEWGLIQIDQTRGQLFYKWGFKAARLHGRRHATEDGLKFIRFRLFTRNFANSGPFCLRFYSEPDKSILRDFYASLAARARDFTWKNFILVDRVPRLSEMSSHLSGLARFACEVELFLTGNKTLYFTIRHRGRVVLESKTKNVVVYMHECFFFSNYIFFLDCVINT